MENFFNIVEPSFFNVFTGQSKEVNYEILLFINSKMKDEVDSSYEKKEIIDWVKDFMDNHPSFQQLVDEEENIEIKDSKKWAEYKINYFFKNGWFSSETIGFKQLFTMNAAAIAILKAMEDVVKNETKPIEYTGYVYNIYTALKYFDINKATEIIEMLEDTAIKFNNSLRSVNLSIKKHINTLLKSDRDVKSILTTLLEDYHNNVVAKVFTNLRTRDNPSKYKFEIISKIDNLLDNNLDDIINNYLKVKKRDNKDEAKDYIEEVLLFVREIFENISDNIESLNKRNEKYVQTANARVQFLLNDSKDVEGEIYNILKMFENMDISCDTEFSFGLKDLTKKDGLYHPRKRKHASLIKYSFIKPPIDKQFEKKEIELIKRGEKFNINNINRWILEKIGNRDFIEAKQINITHYDEFIILFLAMIYSTETIVGYEIEYLQNSFVKFNNSKLENFKIRRK